MFSFFSLGRSKTLLKRAVLVCLTLGLLWAVLASCDSGTIGGDDVNIPGALPAELAGTWEDYDSFTIDTTTNPATLEYDGGGWGDYQGTIVFVSNYDSKSGLIIVEYTTGAPDTGKPFHSIYYLNLTSGTVSLNNTWQDNGGGDYNADTATLDEAKEKFTLGQMGNYMDVSQAPTYTKAN